MNNRREQLLRIVSALTSDQDTALKYAAHLEELFDHVKIEAIGKDFRTALQAEDYQTAVRLCAAHFRAKADLSLPELSYQGSFDLQVAENAVKGIVTVVNIPWAFPDGEMDFLFNPTKIQGPVNHEWLWQLNRHSFWIHMSRAYRTTRDEKFADAFRNQLLTWIAQTEIPEQWNAPDSAFRTIECGLRLLGSWQVAFDGFKVSPSVDDVTLLLMLASMHCQSAHLVAHPTGKNWLMMESNGIYSFSVLFDEFSDAEDNRRIATDFLLAQVRGQILPDGMHNELSPDYQGVVFHCAANFYSLAKALGQAGAIPADLLVLLDQTAHAAILLSTPALTQPRTNDTYTIPTASFTGRAERLLGAKPEYTFVNTLRREGKPPQGATASAFLPYAGFAVMRSDWGADANYLCFDIGPLGMAHCHQDKLNINLYQGSQELIYDDGGGQYEKSSAREYARSGYGHNTVLVDGLAQNRKEPRQAEAAIDAGWITNESFDYAVGVYDDTFGEALLRSATHKREVRFCKPDLFCISDTLTSLDGNLHDYELLFHLDTTEAEPLAEYPNGVISKYGKDREIAIIPLDREGDLVELKRLSAVTEPRMQGWYNGRNDQDLHPAITVSRSVSGVKNFRFDTLLIPVKAGASLPKVIKKSETVVMVTFDHKEYEFDLERLHI